MVAVIGSIFRLVIYGVNEGGTAVRDFYTPFAECSARGFFSSPGGGAFKKL